MREQLLKFIGWTANAIRQRFRYDPPDLPYYLTIVIAIIVFAVTMSGFVEITESLTENKLNVFDDAVTSFILQFRREWLTDILTVVTDLGDRFAYIAIILVLSIFFWLRYRNWKFSLQMIIVLTLSALSNVAIKQVVNRARPAHDHLVEVNTLSFPSGHSMSAMAFYGFLIYLTTRFSMPRAVRIIILTALTGLIALIGVSRIYLGVHFPSDVAAGFLGGVLWVTFCAVIFNIIDLLRKRRRGNHRIVRNHRL